MEGWAIGLVAVSAALLAIYYTHLVSKWKNPKRKNGVLPPGSMGWPVIGETLQFITRSKSLDVHPFVKKRIQKYGPVFKTSLVGRPIIVSTDYEVNKYIMTHEGSLVEIWYLDSFAKFFALQGETRANAVGRVHAYIRSITLKHFGVDSLKGKLLPEVEEMVQMNLKKWSAQGLAVDMKQGLSAMLFNFGAKHLFGYDAERSKKDLSENYTRILSCFISLPLNIPGTSLHRCMKDQEELLKILKEELMVRLNSPERIRRGDYLDQAIDDMETHKFLTVDFIPNFMLGILFVTFETVSTTLTLILKLLAENAEAVEELRAEHEGIIKERKNPPDSGLTWEEYKSMTFTQMVISEALRIGNIPPGLFRKALKDFEIKGYTVPAGWNLMLVTPHVHFNPDTYQDPLTFNPWRWKDLDQLTISKNFLPFGGGTRQCAGAEYSKLILATFLHHLVTKYRFIKVKGGDVFLNPLISFGDGIHIKFIPLNN